VTNRSVSVTGVLAGDNGTGGGAADMRQEMREMKDQPHVSFY